MKEEHILALGRASLWYKAAKEALYSHLCNCPDNENVPFDWETGYVPSHCKFPSCFTDGYNHEGERQYNTNACDHCQEARRLSDIKYSARLELSKRRGIVLRGALTHAKRDNERGLQ